MKIILAPEARAELREATDLYAQKSPDVARQFAAAYKLAKRLIAEAPLRWPEIEADVRRVLLDRFPYALLHVIEDGHVLVLAVKHHKRHPDYWKDRFRK